MITKERLEELIEKGATIWKVPYGTPIETKLHKLSFVGNKLNLKEDYLMESSLKNCDYIMSGILSQLFEIKEDAEEYAEFGNITKTERLKLPNWSDIFPDKENHFYHGTYNCWWDDCCKYDIYINAFITDNNFKKGYFDINGHREFGITKESYTNIRRYAVKLFYGEEECLEN